MADGINLECPDGQRRLCFPVLAHYIADYEEQRMLASIISGCCPKCTIPRYKRSSNHGVPMESLPQPQPPATYSSGMQLYPARENDEAKRLRILYRRPVHQNIDNADLKAFGYHETVPFTEHHIYSNIYDALAPDVLHQVLKCSYDYVHDWMIKTIKEEGLLMKTEGEIDARFSQIPPYPGLRTFSKGISPTSRWTGNEIRKMMRVYGGVIKGLVPDSCSSFIRNYLDILCMSEYMSHTDSTLQMLDTAINRFWKELWNPRGPFVKYDIIVPGWYCPKLHYFQHYTEQIRLKGVLSFCSTNRTEEWHKTIKDAYRRRNKGPQSLEFCVRDEARRLAWRVWEGRILRGFEEHSDLDMVDRTKSNGPGHEITAGKEWAGVRKIEWVQKELGEVYSQLAMETSRCLRWIELGRNATVARSAHRDGDWGGLTMGVHNQLTIVYPTVHDPQSLITEALHSTQSWNYGQNHEWKKPRRDTGLFRYDRDNNDKSTMGSRRVGRLLLLFKTEDPRSGAMEELSLAYVQWFKTLNLDKYTGMYRVRKTDNFEVVEIDTVERGVHLIPCFTGLATEMASSSSLPTLDVYTDFWLNNQIDNHMYNTIY